MNPALAEALKKLKTRERFEAEIVALLAGYAAAEAEEALRFLRERRIVDDERLIQNLIERASGKRAVGKEKLRAELLKRGAPEEMVERHLSMVPDDGEIDGLIAAKYRLTDGRAKVARFLFGRGFDEEQIEAALDRFFGTPED